MKVITAPDYENHTELRNRIFLGGGISGCPDWQAIMIDLLNNGVEKINFDFPTLDDRWIMFNPRRPVYDITDETQGLIQINWEDHKLKTSDIILFWFPEETLCPITLLELGKYGCRPNVAGKVFVGCHKNYARKFDVETQLYLSQSGINVVTNLVDLSQQVIDSMVSKSY